MPRYAMVIDLETCYGCDACKMACRDRYLSPPSVTLAEVLKVDVKGTGNTPPTRLFLPHLCMQCDAPPCRDACEDEAIHIQDGGIVVIDPDRCTGCAACVSACPYDAMYIVEEPLLKSDENPLLSPEEKRLMADWQKRFANNTPAKCDFCAELVAKGRLPRCVAVCPVGAHTFGDLDDPDDPLHQLLSDSVVAPLLDHLGTRPKVFYRPPKGRTLSETERLVLKRGLPV